MMVYIIIMQQLFNFICPLWLIAVCSKEDLARMEVGGQSSSTCRDVHMTLAPTNADQMSVGNYQTNGEVSSKTSAVCKSTKDGEKSSDSDSECDATLVHSHSRSSRNLGSRHQKRKVVHVPYSLMSPKDKEAQLKRDRSRKKRMVRKLEQRLENSSRQKRKKIKRHLKRLRPHNRGKHKKKATDTEADKEPSSQK